MKIYYTINRKIIFLILCTMMLAVCFASRFSEVQAAPEDGITNQKRLDFLESIGCFVNTDDFSEKEITVPLEFSPVYNNYNEIQKDAGYDLSKYKGEKCTMYSFSVIKFKDFNDKSNAKANLIVYNGRIIGGDVSSPSINGKMYPLKK